MIAAAERAGAAGERDLHIDLLWLVASHAFWVDPGPEVRRQLIGAAARLGGADAADPRVFAIHAYADPLGHTPEVLARLRSAERLDTDAARYFGLTAQAVGAFDLGTDFLAAAVDGMRAEGRLGNLLRPLVRHAEMAARLGAWDVAITAAEEAKRLASELAAAARGGRGRQPDLARRRDARRRSAGGAARRAHRGRGGVGGCERHGRDRPVRQGARRDSAAGATRTRMHPPSGSSIPPTRPITR